MAVKVFPYPPASICTFYYTFDTTFPNSHSLSLSFSVTHNWFVTGIAITSAAAEAVPPGPAQVQSSCDPHGRSEAEESRTGLNPVRSPWLQFNGLRTTLNNSSSHVNKTIAKT